MKTIIYKEVKIECWSNSLTQKNINQYQVLDYVDGYADCAISASSISKAKKIVDAAILSGALVLDNRLILTIKQHMQAALNGGCENLVLEGK